MNKSIYFTNSISNNITLGYISEIPKQQEDRLITEIYPDLKFSLKLIYHLGEIKLRVSFKLETALQCILDLPDMFLSELHKIDNENEPLNSIISKYNFVYLDSNFIPDDLKVKTFSDIVDDNIDTFEYNCTFEYPYKSFDIYQDYSGNLYMYIGKIYNLQSENYFKYSKHNLFLIYTDNNNNISDKAILDLIRANNFKVFEPDLALKLHRNSDTTKLNINPKYILNLWEKYNRSMKLAENTTPEFTFTSKLSLKAVVDTYMYVDKKSILHDISTMQNNDIVQCPKHILDNYFEIQYSEINEDLLEVKFKPYKVECNSVLDLYMFYTYITVRLYIDKSMYLNTEHLYSLLQNKFNYVISLSNHYILIKNRETFKELILKYYK